MQLPVFLCYSPTEFICCPLQDSSSKNYTMVCLLDPESSNGQYMDPLGVIASSILEPWVTRYGRQLRLNLTGAMSPGQSSEKKDYVGITYRILVIKHATRLYVRSVDRDSYMRT